MRVDFGSHFFYAYTHKVKYRPRKERDKYPNLVYSTWDTVDRPRQVIVSDMTMIKGPFFLFEVTFYFDVFTKEMLTFQVGLRRGDRPQYIEGYQSRSEVHMALSRYQHYYNKMRPCFALDYDTPRNFLCLPYSFFCFENCVLCLYLKIKTSQNCVFSLTF